MGSHLFNQGTNSIELIKSESDALDKLRTLIKQKAAAGTAATMIAPLDVQKHHVIFGVITRKDKALKSQNLPLFSRISLSRSLKALQIMSVKAGYGFIEDQSPKTAGKKKEKKKKP